MTSWRRWATLLTWGAAQRPSARAQLWLSEVSGFVVGRTAGVQVAVGGLRNCFIWGRWVVPSELRVFPSRVPPGFCCAPQKIGGESGNLCPHIPCFFKKRAALKLFSPSPSLPPKNLKKHHHFLGARPPLHRNRGCVGPTPRAPDHGSIAGIASGAVAMGEAELGERFQA